MSNKHTSILLTVIFLFLGVIVYGNLPDSTPRDGTNKPEASTGNDGKDGIDQPQRCPICNQPLGSSGGSSDAGNSGNGEPGCISMDFHFGHLVHTDVISAGSIKLLSDAPLQRYFLPKVCF